MRLFRRVAWHDSSCCPTICFNYSHATEAPRFLHLLAIAGLTAAANLLSPITASAQSAAEDCSQKSYLECLDCCDKQFESCLDKAASQWNDANRTYRQCLTDAMRERNRNNADCTQKRTACEASAAQFQQTNPPEYARLMAECQSNEQSCKADAQTKYDTKHSECAAALSAARDQYEVDKANCVTKHIACQLGCKRRPVQTGGSTPPVTPPLTPPADEESESTPSDSDQELEALILELY